MSNFSETKPYSRMRGSVLLYVIWVMVLLSVLMTSISTQVESALGVTSRLTEQLQAAQLARAGLQYAALAISDDAIASVDALQEMWSDNPSMFHDHPVGRGRFSMLAGLRPDGTPRYGLIDEERYVNLNTAPAEVLRALVQRAGQLPDDDAQIIAESIEDWRDPDDDARPQGAENFYYRGRTEAYACKDGPFETIEELRLVRGMSEAIYDRLAPHVTVYGSGQLNLNTATREALDALALSRSGVTGLLAFRAGADGVEGNGDDARLVSVMALESELSSFLPVEDLARLAQLQREKFLGVASTAFRAVVEARTEHPSGIMTVTCVFDRQGRVLSWSER